MPPQAEEGDSTRIVCEWVCVCVFGVEYNSNGGKHYTW